MYFNSFLPFHPGCFKPPSRLNWLTEGNQTRAGRLIMSTHDAAKVDLRFLGGEKEREEETEAPKVPVQRDGNWKRTNKTERPQDVRWSQENNHHGNEVETDQWTQTPLSANSGGIEQTELTLGTREESHGRSAVLNRNPNQTWFTSSLSFRLSSQHSKKYDLEKLESTAQREHCLHSSQGPVRDAPIAQAQVKREVSPSYYFVPANCPSEEEEVTSLTFKEEEDSKTAMLSSTLVSVLAPQWSGRIRRNKRGMAGTDISVFGTATSESGQETQGNGQEVSEGGVLLKPQVPLETDSVGQRRQFLETQNQRVGERGLTLGSQVHERASTLGSSRSTVGGWYEGSTPSLKLDNPTKAPVSKPVSLDVSWGRLANRGGEGGAVSPVTPSSPLSPDLHAHKGMLQASRQGAQTSLLSSKPTTSSLLFSLRRLNTIASSIHSETNISSLTNDRDGETSSPHLSPTTTNYKASEAIRAHLSLTSSNDGARERSKFLPYSADPTYRTIERSRHLPLPTSNHREANTHRTQLFSTSPNYKDTEGTPFTKLPQTSRAYPNPTFPSKQTLLFSGLERLSPSERPDGTTVPISDTHLPSSPPSQYDHLDFHGSQSLPRGTTLRSTSWRKHITLEDSVSNPSSPLSPTTTTTINNNNNTFSLSSTSSNNNTGPSSTNDNTGVNPQISINNNNNLVTPNNTNLNSNTVTGKHTPQSTLKRTYVQDIPDQDSYRILKTQNSLNSNDRQSQKPYCLSNISFRSNTSSPASSSTLSSPIKSSKPDRYSRQCSYDTIYTPLTVFSPKTPTSSETSDTPSSLSSHRNLYLSHSLNPSSRQLSLQTSIASTSLSSHRPLYSSRSLNTASSMRQDPQNSPKSPPPVVRSQIPIVSNTHTPTSQLQSPKTAYTPTTTPQPLLLKTVYVPSILTRYTRPLSPDSYTPISLSIPTTQAPSTLPLSPPSSSPLVERTFIGSLDLSPKKHQPQVEGRVTAHRAWQESQLRLSQSHSPQRPLSPTRPLRSVEGPAIFSSLRSGSPTWATSPLSPPTPRTTKLQVWRGTSMHNLSIISDTLVKEGGQALSEHVSDHTSNVTFKHTGTDSTVIGPQRKTAAPLSLPDFGSFSKPRFSSPPYSTLKSSRPTQGEVTHTTSHQPLLSPQHYPFYGHHRARSQDSSKIVALEIDCVNNNSKQTSQENVETLVYRISKVDSSAILDSIRPAQPCFPRHTPDTRVVTGIKSNELCCLPSQHSQVIGSPSCQSYQSSNDSGALDIEKVVCKSESFPKSAAAPLQTQSPKKGLFSLRGKRDNVVGTPAANIPRNPAMPQSEKPEKESEKEQKESNKIDLVLSRLRQTFRVKRLDDERTKRTPQPPPVKGASDISDVTESSGSSNREEEEKWRENDGVHKPSNSFWGGSEHTSDMTKENVRREHSQFEGFKDHKEARNRDQPCVMDLPQFEAYKDERITKPKHQPSSSEISPTRQQFEAYKDERITKPKHQPSSSEISPTRQQFEAYKDERITKPKHQTSSSEISPTRRQFEAYKDERITKPKHQPSSSEISPTRQQFEAYKDERITKPKHQPSSSEISPTRQQFEAYKDERITKPKHQPSSSEISPTRQQFEAYKDERITKPKHQPSSSEISPTRRQFEAYKEERISRARKQPPQRDFSSVMRQPWDPSRSATLPAYRTSSGSTRNTFSVFHFSQKDSENDNVFHIPRIPQRKKTTSLCEPGDREFGSGDQRGSEGRLASFSSCADLKYGLEAGRSFSVTSVLSSRPSGPGRISSGPRVSSVSDLTYPALTFGEEVMTWDDCRVKGDWTIPRWDTHTTTGHKTTGDSQAVNDWSVVSDRTSRNERKTIKANFINPHKARSKSLPRNVSWSSEVTAPSPTSTTTGRMWNHGSLETSHSLWDTEGPPTPPLSPPWSPASRRISRPPSSSSSASPSPTDSRASQDSLSPRGRLPSRGYVSNLAVFEESDSGSDMDSDTTTDDEYYLAGDGGEKETEL
nr:uncharacterized protein LOC115105020 [Oncorhynchus nerka]